MIAEIIAAGSEMLTPYRQDTKFPWIDPCRVNSQNWRYALDSICAEEHNQ